MGHLAVMAIQGVLLFKELGNAWTINNYIFSSFCFIGSD
jgi:hypothetical protein